MLNTDRVRLMSQMALIERKNGTKIDRMINFSRRDYIGRALLFCFLSTTIFSLCIIGLAAGYLFLYRLDDLLNDTVYFIVVAVVAYAVFLYARMMLAARRASREYREGYVQLAALRSELGELRRLYDDEARQTRSLGAAAVRNGGNHD